VRWLASKGRAVGVIKQNLKAVCVHLEECAVNNKGGEGARAKGYLTQLRSYAFLKTLHTMLDFLPVMLLVSKVMIS
jgi:hypothetical protein